MDGFCRLHRSDGMEGQPAIRDIQHEAAVFGTHPNIGNFHELRAWRLAALGRRVEKLGHWHRQLYFRLGSWIICILLRRFGRTHSTRRIHPESPCSLSCGKRFTSKGKNNRIARKVYCGYLKDRRAAAEHLSGTKMICRDPPMYNAAYSRIRE